MSMKAAIFAVKFGIQRRFKGLPILDGSLKVYDRVTAYEGDVQCT